ncbi:hypothetical protein V8C35DRAFT_309411 [Trichoderma chlorosporum]
MDELPIDFRALVAPHHFAPETETKLADLLKAAVNADKYYFETYADAIRAAANYIDQLCPRNEDAEAFLWALWTIIIDVAKRIPFDDYERVENFMEVIKALKHKGSGRVEIWGASHNLWADLPLFGAVMREAWNARPEFDGSADQATKIEQWKSLNSFAAYLLGASVQYWSNLALWELRDALEEPHLNEQAKDTRLITASEWIIRAGPVLCGECLRRTRLDEQSKQALAPGALFEGGDPGFTEDRWAFWVKRLDELKAAAVDEDVKDKMETAWEMILSLEVGVVLGQGHH